MLADFSKVLKCKATVWLQRQAAVSIATLEVYVVLRTKRAIRKLLLSSSHIALFLLLHLLLRQHLESPLNLVSYWPKSPTNCLNAKVSCCFCSKCDETSHSSCSALASPLSNLHLDNTSLLTFTTFFIILFFISSPPSSSQPFWVLQRARSFQANRSRALGHKVTYEAGAFADKNDRGLFETG